IRRLEKNHPGITKELSDSFGIFDFARYPDEVLIEQFEDLKKPDDQRKKPHALIAYPRYDWNGSFYFDREIFQNFYRNLKKNGYSLRLVEVEDTRDIARRLNRTRKKFG